MIVSLQLFTEGYSVFQFQIKQTYATSFNHRSSFQIFLSAFLKTLQCGLYFSCTAASINGNNTSKEALPALNENNFTFLAGIVRVYSPQCSLSPFHSKMALLTYVQLVIHCNSQTFPCRTVMDRTVTHSVNILSLKILADSNSQVLYALIWIFCLKTI